MMVELINELNKLYALDEARVWMRNTYKNTEMNDAQKEELRLAFSEWINAWEERQRDACDSCDLCVVNEVCRDAPPTSEVLTSHRKTPYKILKKYMGKIKPLHRRNNIL